MDLSPHLRTIRKYLVRWGILVEKRREPRVVASFRQPVPPRDDAHEAETAPAPLFEMPAVMEAPVFAAAARAPVAAPVEVPVMAFEPEPVFVAAPVVLASPVVAAPAPVAPQPAPAPAPAAKPMRSIEEVRADLARLREASRERQVKTVETRDIGFAATDFLDFTELPSKKAAPAQEEFAATAYLDFTLPKPAASGV